MKIKTPILHCESRF